MTFFEILKLYVWTFPFLALSSAMLAFCGAHLAARERTLQSLSISQGAELGSIAFMLLALILHLDLQEVESWMTLPAAVGIAFLAGSFAGKSEKFPASSRATALFALWIGLFALTQVIVAGHPALESHFSKIAIGDIATITSAESQVLCLVSIVFSLVLFSRRWEFLRASFSISLMGNNGTKQEKSNSMLLLLIPAVSTWSSGFSLTCATLFIPTTMHSLFQKAGGARSHIIRCVCDGLLGAPLGLFISLTFFPGLPTVSVMVLTLLSFSFVSARFFKF